MDRITTTAKTDRLVSWGIPFSIVASYLLLAVQPDLRLAVPLLTAVAAAITILLAATWRAGEKGTIPWTPAAILLVATAVRLLFVFRAPELSDDIYRYLWDGLQTLAGVNPYAFAPADTHAVPEALSQLPGRINHADLVTVYPPAAQFVFSAGAALGGGVVGLKVLLTALDIAACYLCIRLLAALQLPPWRAVFYAWHPLPVIEIAGSGHIDGAAILFLLAAFCLAGIRKADGASNPPLREDARSVSGKTVRSSMAGIAFACAVLVKLFPLVFLPGCLLLLTRRGRIVFGIGFVAAGAALAVPFLPELKNALHTLGLYAGYWEHSGFVYGLIDRAVHSKGAARGIIAGIFLLVLLLSYRSAWRKNAGPGHERSARLPQVFYSIAMAFLFLTVTLFPWYALYLAALLPFAAGPAGFTLCCSVFLSYGVLFPSALPGWWPGMVWIPAIIWLAPAVAFLLSSTVKRVKEIFRSTVPPGR